MKSRIVALVAVTAAGVFLLGAEARLHACSPHPTPKTMELLASYPDDGGVLPTDREAVLVFSTGSVYTDTPESSILWYPPQDFAAWEIGGRQDQSVAVEVLETNPQKWTGIGIPEEIREWKTSFTKKEVVRMYRLKAKAGWKSGATYRIDYQIGDVSGMVDYWEEEPTWVPHSLYFMTGTAAGPIDMLQGQLDVEFVEEYSTCLKKCWDGADCYDCQGLASVVQVFHLSSYGLSVDDATGPLVVRFHSSGTDLSSPGAYQNRAYIVLPGAPSPLDVRYYRRGPSAGEGAADGCEVCVGISVESADGTALDAPDDQCIDAYQIPKPPEPCDPDDWDYERGDEPPTLLHWPVCESETGRETGDTDVVQTDAREPPEGQPDVQAGTVPTDSISGADVGAADGGTPGGLGDSGCSAGATTPADSVWLSLALLLIQLLMVQGLRGFRRGFPVPAMGAAGRFRQRGG